MSEEYNDGYRSGYENGCEDATENYRKLVEKRDTRIAELEAVLKQMLELADEEFLWDYPQVYAARAALGEKE